MFCKRSRCRRGLVTEVGKLGRGPGAPLSSLFRSLFFSRRSPAQRALPHCLNAWNRLSFFSLRDSPASRTRKRTRSRLPRVANPRGRRLSRVLACFSRSTLSACSLVTAMLVEQRKGTSEKTPVHVHQLQHGGRDVTCNANTLIDFDVLIVQWPII